MPLLSPRPLLIAALMTTVAVAGPHAQELVLPQTSAGQLPLSATNEVRVGLHAHSTDYRLFPFWVQDFDMSLVEDVSFDLLFASPDIEAFRWVGSPRPEIGMTLNLGEHESLFRTGLTWSVPVFDTPLFLEGTFGGALQTGYVLGAPSGDRNLGCRINFYERFGVGTRLGDNATALITYEHTSNAGLCEANDGFSNLGLRVGWTF